ncbi:MAG: lactate utilization protein [Clostridia bacterium]|nr:lactate utilization protein [Clostridia bacterium]
MTQPQKDRYTKLGESVVKTLKARHFEACYCPDVESARRQLLEWIPAEHTVAWGGSQTLEELGAQDLLRARGQALIDRDTAKTPEERNARMHAALSADTFMMSSNAITENGQLVNMDGNGNRVAALIYGPKSVIVVAGLNKIAKDLPAAIARVRGTAAPTNAQRFPVNTPCKTTGTCADCISPDCICANLVITRVSRPAGKIKVILVGEDLGM